MCSAAWMGPRTSPSASASERYRRWRISCTRCVPAEPHWYLGTIGTLVGRRRQGCGTAVLRPVLDHLDRIGAKAYLETSAVENVAFYERLGFVVVAGLEGLPHGAPDTWGMQRPA